MSLKANPSQKRSKGDLPAPKIRSPSAKRPAAYEHDSKEFIDLTGPTPAPSEPDAEKEAQVTEQIEGTVQEMLEVAESACKSGKSAELMGPTLLGRAFRAFSELPLDSLTLVTINDLRDKIRYGRYNRETGAEPGESFAAAIAWETIAKQFPVLCVEFKTATCYRCGQWLAKRRHAAVKADDCSLGVAVMAGDCSEEYVSFFLHPLWGNLKRVAILDLVDPEYFDGSKLPDQTGAHIERSLGKHDFIAKKPLEGCGSTEFGSAHALARRPPRYMSLGDTYRTSLPGHLWGRRFEIQAWGQDLQPVAISLTFKAIMVCQGAHFTVFWSHGTENRLWKYNDALSAEIHIVVTSAREADMRTAASAGLPFLVLETDQGRYEEESQ
ncbi:hypothetical protein IWX49DRAFT_589086 [Phyllosticta citricarpa]|uniref:Uncharacterized protein n=2 Tax=Phyllosticta TaxID=121621 RepID=A0ABR1MFU5_9PEZI